MKAIFTKMGEIDTAKECFTAEVIIQAKWREELLDGVTEEVLSWLYLFGASDAVTNGTLIILIIFIIIVI